jgi:hypothetical protein
MVRNMARNMFSRQGVQVAVKYAALICSYDFAISLSVHGSN